MTAKTMEAKTGNLMASTWTQAAMVRRAFNAGPRRKTDRAFDDIEDAVLAAYSSFLDLRKAMRSADLSTRDVRAALVLMTAAYEGPPINAGLVTLLAIPDSIASLPVLLKEAEKLTKTGAGAMVPLGLAFWQRDKDAKAKTSKAVWVQLWRVDPRLQRAADVARAAFEEADGRVPEDGLNETFEEFEK